jgi:hypothetical protein
VLFLVGLGAGVAVSQVALESAVDEDGKLARGGRDRVWSKNQIDR